MDAWAFAQLADLIERASQPVCLSNIPQPMDKRPQHCPLLRSGPNSELFGSKLHATKSPLIVPASVAEAHPQATRTTHRPSPVSTGSRRKWCRPAGARRFLGSRRADSAGTIRHRPAAASGCGAKQSIAPHVTWRRFDLRVPTTSPPGCARATGAGSAAARHHCTAGSVAGL